jgi:hypothetical protein
MAYNLLSDLVKESGILRKRPGEPALFRNLGQYIKVGIGLDAIIEGGVRIYQRAAINDIMIQEYLRKATVITDEVVKSANNLPLDNIWWGNQTSALVGTGMIIVGGVLLASGVYNIAKDANKQAINEVLDDIAAASPSEHDARPKSYNPSDNYFKSS